MPASDAHVFIAEAAEAVRKAAQEAEIQEWAEKLLETLPDMPPLLPSPPLTTHPSTVQTCTCPPYGTCMNVMCPRATRITC